MPEEIYPTSDLVECVNEMYRQAEALKLTTWRAVRQGQKEMEWSGQIEPGEGRIDAHAVLEKGVLKVVINDVLPRRKNESPAAIMRLYWMMNVVDAIKKLGIAIRYERALCSITVYGQRDVGWDLDNRAISYIINGLRMADVIPGDEWYHLSLVLLGGLDKENPRTEIRVTEYSEDDIKRLFNGV